MNINQAGLDLIKSFEGCKLQSYQDVVGIWTIGYGAIGPEVVKGLKWTQQQADDRLKKDVAKFEASVQSALTKPVNPNQFSALVCFAYNVGAGSLKTSTLLKKLNANDPKGAAEEFIRWNKAGGKEVAGLTRRRLAERDLFLKSVEVQSTKAQSTMLPEGPSDGDINKMLEEIEKKVKL